MYHWASSSHIEIWNQCKNYFKNPDIALPPNCISEVSLEMFKDIYYSKDSWTVRKDGSKVLTRRAFNDIYLIISIGLSNVSAVENVMGS